MRRAAIAVVALVTLAGCSSATPPEPNGEGANGPIREETITLNDGRTVMCLTYDRALDCDWSAR